MATETPSTTAPVGWFEIGTDDPDQAHRFYGEMFSWTFSQSADAPYTFVTTGPDHPLQGGIQDTGLPLPDGFPRSYAIFYVVVDDVAATCARVEELGGKVLVPATAIPTGLVYAQVTDPAGNHFGLFHPPGT